MTIDGHPGVVGRGPDDEGAATVLMVGIVVTMVVVLALGLTAADTLMAASRARTGADMAALAGALAAREAFAAGRDAEGPGCSAAGEAADRNGAVVTACSARGAAVTVTVVAGDGVTRQTASATAGPAFAASP